MLSPKKFRVLQFVNRNLFNANQRNFLSLAQYQSSRFLMAKNSSDVEFVKSAEELNECLKKRPPLTLNVRAIIVEKLTSFIYEYERLHRRQSSQNSCKILFLTSFEL